MMLVAISNMLLRYGSQIPVLGSLLCLDYYFQEAGNSRIDSVVLMLLVIFLV